MNGLVTGIYLTIISRLRRFPGTMMHALAGGFTGRCYITHQSTMPMNIRGDSRETPDLGNKVAMGITLGKVSYWSVIAGCLVFLARSGNWVTLSCLKTLN